MNRIMLTLIIFLLASTTTVLGVTPTPQPILTPSTTGDDLIIQKIDLATKEQEQFFSMEMQKQNAYFLSEFTKRANYYEESYKDIMNNAVMKLAGMWAGIFLVLTCLQMMLNYWAEKRRYAVLKKALKMDVVREVKKEYVMIPDKEIKFLNDYLVKTKQMEKGERGLSLWEKWTGKKKVMVQKTDTNPVQVQETPQFMPEVNNQVMEDLLTKMKRGN